MDSAESLSSILWTLTPHPGESLRRDIIAAAGLCQFRIPVSGAGRLSPLRREDWVLCVRAWTVRISEDFVGHCIARFSLLGGKKTLFVYPFLLVFWITADRDYCTNFVGASPFHQIGWAEPYWKKRSCGLDC